MDVSGTNLCGRDQLCAPSRPTPSPLTPHSTLPLDASCHCADLDGPMLSSALKACTAAQRCSCQSDPLEDQDLQAGISSARDPSHHCPGLVPHAWQIPTMAMTWHDIGDIGSTFFELDIPAGHMHEKLADFDMISGRKHAEVPRMDERAVVDVAELRLMFGKATKSRRTKGKRPFIHASTFVRSAMPPVKGGNPSDDSDATVHRRITNSTGLRSLFVTSAMFKRLLLGDTNKNAKIHRNAGAKGRPIIDATIVIRDANMRDWPVTFKTTISFKQYHRHLKTGWKHFCAANNVCVGNVVEFQRLPGDGIFLHARVLPTT